MYIWIKLLHILGVFAFLMAHGASASMALRLQREKSPKRIRAMLDLSTAFQGVVYAAIGILLVAGIAAGFAGHWWSRGCLWLSLVLFAAMATAMYLLGTTYYNQARKAVGLASETETMALLARKRPVLLALIGGGGLAVLAGLMALKPF